MKSLLLPFAFTSVLLNASPLTEEKAVTKGNELSGVLLQKLGGELKHQMQTSGVIGALNFCSQHALTLTDQIAKESNTPIKRVSLKYRNPVNKASIQETELLKEWDNLIKNNQPLPSHKVVNVSGNTTMYYKPIVINNEACLKCHGKIDGELAKAIKAVYPEDKATDYKMGDIRGMIAIEITP
jgi:hypothetical protein